MALARCRRAVQAVLPGDLRAKLSLAPARGSCYSWALPALSLARSPVGFCLFRSREHEHPEPQLGGLTHGGVLRRPVADSVAAGLGSRSLAPCRCLVGSAQHKWQPADQPYATRNPAHSEPMPPAAGCRAACTTFEPRPAANPGEQRPSSHLVEDLSARRDGWCPINL